jgi:hypothetical protein
VRCDRGQANNKMRDYLEGSLADIARRKKGRDETPAAPNGAAAAGDSLPCLNSNNSISHLSNSHKKTAFALTENIQKLVKKYGLERIGFLTLTFADHVTDGKEAQRRFNSWNSNVFRKRYAESICVPERMKSGRLHLHLLVVLDEDIRTGFDFEGVANSDYRSANTYLRNEWAFLRKSAKAYGFGRTELLPIKSTAEGIAKYVGKYISKNLGERRADDKGARLVRYTKGARQVTSRFSWVSPGAIKWRERVGELAEAIDAKDMGEITEKLGPRWAYRMRVKIMDLPHDNITTEWRTGLYDLALSQGGNVSAKPLHYVEDGKRCVVEGGRFSSLDEFLQGANPFETQEKLTAFAIARGLLLSGRQWPEVIVASDDPF